MQKSKLSRFHRGFSTRSEQFKIQNERVLGFLHFALLAPYARRCLVVLGSFSILTPLEIQPRMQLCNRYTAIQPYGFNTTPLKVLCKFLTGLIFTFSIFPSIAFAANVYLETARTEFFVGDTILIEVKVDSKDKEINTVEGKISLDYLPDVILIKDISLSESSFSLWPNKPSLSEDLKTISFVGGVPSGLKYQDAILFKIALNLKNTGQITLNPTDTSVYLNDGKGTKDIANIQNLTINVLSQETGYKPINDLDTLISEDKTPPDFIEAIISRDPYLFDNQYFVSFFAMDKDSGIAYYEVKEGELDFVQAESPYLLQDQSLKGIVQVKAFDKAGNESAITPELAPAPAPEIPYRTYLIWGLITLAILSLVFWLWKIWRNIKK